MSTATIPAGAALDAWLAHGVGDPNPDSLLSGPMFELVRQGWPPRTARLTVMALTLQDVLASFDDTAFIAGEWDDEVPERSARQQIQIAVKTIDRMIAGLAQAEARELFNASDEPGKLPAWVDSGKAVQP